MDGCPTWLLPAGAAPPTARPPDLASGTAWRQALREETALASGDHSPVGRQTQFRSSRNWLWSLGVASAEQGRLPGLWGGGRRGLGWGAGVRKSSLSSCSCDESPSDDRAVVERMVVGGAEMQAEQHVQRACGRKARGLEP